MTYRLFSGFGLFRKAYHATHHEIWVSLRVLTIITVLFAVAMYIAERYMLGIICDGHNYYRLKTVRDREVVQPTVLKMLGWKLIHVWSVDWMLRPDITVENILQQLK